MKPVLLVLHFLLIFWAPISSAQVISVDSIEKGMFYSDKPTKTFLWESQSAKATLIFIPGGEGHLGLTEDKKI